MIESQDRSGWFGASDTDKVIGRWTSDTWMRWWLQKLGVNRDHFDNKYTLAGTHFEHRILESLGLPMELDKQILLPELKLRVNLDGNTDDCIFECKTYQWLKGFKMPRKYINQLQVQMFSSGIYKGCIVTYGLEEKDYDNFFRPIDPTRLNLHYFAYDKQWIETKYLPKLRVLADCLERGVLPNEAYI